MWESAAAIRKSVVEPSEKVKGTRERSRLMQNENGHLALVTTSASKLGNFSGDFASHVKIEYGVDHDDLYIDED